MPPACPSSTACRLILPRLPLFGGGQPTIGRANAEDKANDVPGKESQSPDQRSSLLWKRIGPADGHKNQWALALKRLDGMPVRIRTLDRSVSVLLHKDSRQFAVTDDIGSNIGDCYLYGIAKPSLLAIVSAALPPLPQSAANAHFYVTCDRWLSADQIAVTVSGHTNTAPCRNFNYRFNYDLGTREAVRAR